ncbi:hypothetical protein L917_21260 [Phytophthora nicotianae]|uniref:Uncharacterized protein n=2 Tax=Phytophthora nicotianae TaxID=4792 RepID=W2M3U8_PHYNI|nr:hypothetical protein L917_21260 [Phytophthora nicotianae]ETM31082.1 hypothetical protein L914_21267 [Phytophthora nicotianae]ETM31087.1 hypothetical protein L914_21266 [Phytophthora nicotianae]ETO59509.1 hypothetical protein F444_22136 [Phytophthora nicotianae P1976]
MVTLDSRVSKCLHKAKSKLRSSRNWTIYVNRLTMFCKLWESPTVKRFKAANPSQLPNPIQHGPDEVSGSILLMKFRTMDDMLCHFKKITSSEDNYQFWA